MRNLLAALQIAPNGGFTGFGPLGKPTGTGINAFATFLSTAIGLLTLIAIIWFVFVIVTGAIGIISSGGDKQAIESARKRITTGIIGLVIVIAAIFIIDLIGYLLGIPFLNILQLFYTLVPGSGTGG